MAVKNQKTAALLNQVLTLLRAANLAARDDPLGFAADPPPIIHCTKLGALDQPRRQRRASPSPAGVVLAALP
jgi:hypothetical protein